MFDLISMINEMSEPALAWYDIVQMGTYINEQTLQMVTSLQLGEAKAKAFIYMRP